MKERKHESWDTHCRECEQDYHVDCLSKCGRDGCPGPCECDCGKPLDRDELYKLHAFVRSLR